MVEHLILLGETVVAIEKSKEARFVKEAEAKGAAVLRGDARDLSVLESAHIAKAKEIVAVTDDDLANIEVALSAREANGKIRLVVRIFDQKLAKMVEKSLGIDAAYSSSARSSRLFAQAAISKNILDSFRFGGTIINAYESAVAANTILVGATVDEVRHKYEVTVLLHEREEGQLDWNPSPSNSLSVGDKLLIMTDREGIERLELQARSWHYQSSITINSNGFTCGSCRGEIWHLLDGTTNSITISHLLQNAPPKLLFRRGVLVL